MSASPPGLLYDLSVLEGSRWDSMQSETATIVAPKTLAIERLDLTHDRTTSGAHFCSSAIERSSSTLHP